MGKERDTWVIWTERKYWEKETWCQMAKRSRQLWFFICLYWKLQMSVSREAVGQPSAPVYNKPYWLKCISKFCQLSLWCHIAVMFSFFMWAETHQGSRSREQVETGLHSQLVSVTWCLTHAVLYNSELHKLHIHTLKNVPCLKCFLWCFLKEVEAWFLCF